MQRRGEATQGSLVTPALIPLDTLREQIAQAVAAAKAYDVPDAINLPAGPGPDTRDGP